MANAEGARSQGDFLRVLVSFSTRKLPKAEIPVKIHRKQVRMPKVEETKQGG